ncbi:50S ribosomal protein L4 [Deferribacter desulfuricans SSM1]|uniref:Large ribosomal subunit protein uL4 n=1 Tax=Deferribacter desulfuricans (strain DSM 14783 / JCM 11476 / NBRC 101012 / SSM1) TaxID=639282 RepID=D3P936_DEFDS|nr:50S ribosomal protein L4 [Deferribacter desulfuricans]BAI81226.1 50S ribosomal protein L4 [Deferribacter desulfuricans SSM1]
MAVIEVLNQENKKVKEVNLDDSIISYPVKPWLMHEVVVMQLACRRAGTHSTKTRGEVRGGGRKPWRQKGTGRARAGSIRSPLWVGGGTIFGPKPRDYSYKMPKKKVKNALKSALRAKLEDNALKIIESLNVENGKTKEAVAILKNFGANRKVLVVYNELDEKVIRAFRNIPYVKLLNVKGLNVYDLINARTILMLEDCLPRITEVLANA